MSLSTTKGYNEFSNEFVSILLREDVHPVLLDNLLELLCCKSSGKLIKLPGGRNDIYLLNISKELSVLLKLYSHGGFFKYFFPKYYFISNRFLHELQLYTDILKDNLPAPDYLGGFWMKRFGFYKCGVITRFISDTTTLENYLNDNFVSIEDKYDILIKCGKILRDMHDIGVFHGDLQIRNILIHPLEKAIYLIDFDKAKKMHSLNLFQRSQNLLRLKRSFIKRNINIVYFDTLVTGYGISDLSYTARLLSFPHIQWKNLINYFFNKRINTE